MALRRSKKKRPRREEFTLKEKIKVGGIDERSAYYLSSMFRTGILERVEYLIATGKEADVYFAYGGPKVNHSLVALKIFRIENTSFLNRQEYIMGDPRFEATKRNIAGIVITWCKKEYGNLKLAKESGAFVPMPFGMKGNVLAMELIENNNVPAPLLKETNLENPQNTFWKIVESVKKMYAKGLAHSDLSEYNILMKGEDPYLIDMGQAVVKEHPKFEEFFERDLRNISSYFKKYYKLDINEEEIIKSIRSNA
ncbi:MAG: serine protein kinase RIO [Candidatus Micrarchaeaceae archaeon]